MIVVVVVVVLGVSSFLLFFLIRISIMYTYGVVSRWRSLITSNENPLYLTQIPLVGSL